MAQPPSSDRSPDTPLNRRFATTRLPEKPTGSALDGTAVRPLLDLKGGSVAHFELAPGRVSHAVTHATVEEIWYFLSGRGEMWRKQDQHEEVVTVEAGVCITIPLGTLFQFRSFGNEPLVFVLVTMPPWPGDAEVRRVDGIWQPTVDEHAGS